MRKLVAVFVLVSAMIAIVKTETTQANSIIPVIGEMLAEYEKVKHEAFVDRMNARTQRP